MVATGIIAGCLAAVGAGLALLKAYTNGPKCKHFVNLTDKIVVITGANTGIGKETAIALSKMGATIVMACRDKSRGEAAVEEVIKATGNAKVLWMELDLADLA